MVDSTTPCESCDGLGGDSIDGVCHDCDGTGLTPVCIDCGGEPERGVRCYDCHRKHADQMAANDGHIRECGNGGDDPENCSPACVRARAGAGES